MADHVATPPGSAMDYREHERTYTSFLEVSKIVALASATIVLALAIFGFGSFWLGIFVLLAATVASAIGLAAGMSSKPLMVVFIISFILMALSVA